ncbi:hypothetical protein CEXT_45571 [Caerostris extrusa]|uniref:Uncharacterized protein n=1 Tax=Caerostris extrusa TaxID=172846 RepID=A0AAV4NJL7_CAEEX|nr:hypothetical protein CEXT_45571 [Caerostris extrusa]
MGKVLKRIADNNASKKKQTRSIFLKKVRTPPGCSNPQNGALHHPPCGQSIRRVHGSAVHSEWGGRGRNQPDDLAMGRKLYLYIIRVQEPNLARRDGSAEDGVGSSHRWTGMIRKRVPEIINLRNGRGSGWPCWNVSLCARKLALVNIMQLAT